MPKMKAQILGVGHCMPDRILTNRELEQMVDTTDEWILERCGVRERRIADLDTNTSDLAYQASLIAIEQAGITAAQIDLIIVGTNTPDMFFPSTACLVQDRLKATRAAAFDLYAGCTGFVYGLDAAEKYLMSDEYQYILVIGAEVLSRIVDYQDRNTCVLFGDGAGAAVIGKGSSGAGILSSLIGADGSGGKHLFMPGGGAAHPTSHETVDQRMHYIRMNGQEVFRFATKITAEVSDRLLAKAGLTYEDVDVFIPHQANMRIIRTAMKRMNIPPEKTLVTLDQFGNTSTACIPVGLSLAVQDGRLKPGDTVLLVSFGAGLTFGGMVLKWGRDPI